MKFLVLLILTVFFIIPVYAQKTEKYYSIDYSYTFSGMKSQEEKEKINDEALKLKNVVTSRVIFKSPEHKYAQLKVTVRAAKSNDENADATPAGPRELKKMLIALGYEPHELKQVLKEE